MKCLISFANSKGRSLCDEYSDGVVLFNEQISVVSVLQLVIGFLENSANG